KAYLKYLTEAKNCSFKVEGTGDLPAMRPALTKLFIEQFGDGTGGLKPWTSLPKAKRQQALDIIMGEVWVPVVLHEIGHNLGLRHNFQGSEDKANFFSNEELVSKGIDYAIPYSTIMEYGDDMRTLPFLGKYDIAALRYGYARQVEVVKADAPAGETELMSLDQVVVDENGAQTVKSLEMVEFKAQIAEKGLALKEYGYCTDESVGPNAGCRRFDEGSTYPEIVSYMIQQYKDAYESRSRRNGRANFSLYEDVTYLRSRYAKLADMRVFIELYEKIKHKFDLADNDEAWEKEEFLKQVKDASLKAANFYLEILATPDVHCLVVAKAAPTKIAGVVPLKQIAGFQDQISCFGKVSLSDKYMVVGQTGKVFNSTKDPNSENPYIDQVDVRGYWLDKAAAARVIFKRDLGPGYSSLNGYLDNLWDIQDVRPAIAEVVHGLMTNKLAVEHVFTLDDGSQIALPVALDYQSTHQIKQALVPGLSKALGIRHSAVYFGEVLGETAASEATTSDDNKVAGLGLARMVGVRVAGPMDDQLPRQYFLAADIGGDRVAYAGASNTIALDLVADMQLNQGLSKVDEAALEAAIKLLEEKIKKSEPPLVASISKEELVAVGLTLSEAEVVVGLSSADRGLDASFALNKLQELAGGQVGSAADTAKAIDQLNRM
ncbi:MAG: zinc-dependent metalloprotease, partial [Bdellovibrionota bacterium]